MGIARYNCCGMLLVFARAIGLQTIYLQLLVWLGPGPCRRIYFASLAGRNSGYKPTRKLPYILYGSFPKKTEDGKDLR
jgi:hypothetical protein